MAKTLDLTKTVFDLSQDYPEFIDIMTELGFSEIAKKPVLHSVGKLMTVPKGAQMKGIELSKIIKAFTDAGFEVIGTGDGSTESSPQPNSPAQSAVTQTEAAIPSLESWAQQNNPNSETKNKRELLKDYLKRLNQGEDLESVRSDFVLEFSDVDASEIMFAEQELMAEGTPLEEVQRLCDVHSALFHGATREEQIAHAELAVQDSLRRRMEQTHEQANTYADTATQLEAVAGHPLQTFTRENKAIDQALAELRAQIALDKDFSQAFSRIRELSTHYAKKGDLLYPLLKVKYDISGPHEVMWSVDDEIRDELAALAGESEHNEWWHTRLENVLVRAEEMIYKEQNILFPICAANFSEDEWYGIYHDSKDYDVCFGVESLVWEAAETNKRSNELESSSEGEIVMPGGHLTLEQLTALLNTIPLEITFVDAHDINRFFNEGHKVFKRPGMALDRDVFSCHPPKIEPMVRSIIEDFRAGKRDRVPVWMDKGGRSMLVLYLAVRDVAGNYLGTVELVQDMEFAKEHFCS
ncbi:MAG: DUF438 domain-containing protein [Atopobiaceae bacterium]|nr:DUF438 domain-containing protein [Atopobiaceae bacterium]